MRSQIVKKGDKTLVLDTYNANPSSMKVSLENFNQFAGSKTIIIGDMLELGEESATEHSQILNLAQSLNFDQIITVGPNFKNAESDVTSFLQQMI
jgi:UDP-N-acetylmuramoyl-tripeptide--D-alanyl-D-alanine ligase